MFKETGEQRSFFFKAVNSVFFLTDLFFLICHNKMLQLWSLAVSDFKFKGLLLNRIWAHRHNLADFNYSVGEVAHLRSPSQPS